MSHFKLPAGVQWGRDFEEAVPKGNLFRSIKTPRPIEFRRRWHLDGLRGLSIDAEVKAISPYVGVPALADEFETPLLVTLAAGKIVVGFSRYPTDQLFCGALPFRCFTRSEVEADPQASTTKAIWSTAGLTVDPADRIRLLRKVGQHADGLPIAELLDLVKWPLIEPVHAILSLIVEGELLINPAQKLRPETLVKRAHFATPISLEPAELKSAEARPAICLLTPMARPVMRTAPAIGKRRTRMRNLNQAELLLPITGGAKARPNTCGKHSPNDDVPLLNNTDLANSRSETSETESRSRFRDQSNIFANRSHSGPVSCKTKTGLPPELEHLNSEKLNELASDSSNDSRGLSEFGFQKSSHSI